jgi:putative transposase
MTSLIERDKIMALVMEAMAAGARQNRACAAISLNKRTLQRWQSDKSTGDARPLRVQLPKNKLSFLERKHPTDHRQFRRIWAASAQSDCS